MRRSISAAVVTLALVLVGCRTTRIEPVPTPIAVPHPVDRPVVVVDSAMVAVMREYIRRADAHPIVFDVSRQRFVVSASPNEQAQIIAGEMTWYVLFVQDVVEWMRSRIE